MFGFEHFLMQTDLISSFESLFLAASTLITTAMGIVVYVLNRKASINKGELTARDKQIMEIAKGTMLAVQKGAENVGAVKQMGQILYQANVSEADRKKIEAQLTPILEEINQRLVAADGQANVVKSTLIKLLGEEANVDNDSALPRESKKISENLRNPLT